MNKREKQASRVLDYWFAIEFLAQDSYEDCTGIIDISKKLKKYKESTPEKKKERKQLMMFVELSGKTPIRTVIESNAKSCEMDEWGNLTFFLGKIERQICIDKLTQILNLSKHKTAEKSVDSIPVLSFQCDKAGVYIPGSLSLSTIVWAISQISKHGVGNISEAFSDKLYKATIDELEKVLFEPKSIEYSQIEDRSLATFDTGTITIEKVIDIYEKLTNIYCHYFQNDSIAEVFGMKYQLFRDEDAKSKYDDDNYTGLSHDFFSADIKMVREKIVSGSYDFSYGMLGDLISYINSPTKPLSDNRYNLIVPQNLDDYTEKLMQSLNVRNAPLGKWPSRYPLAFMQQLAVNFATSQNVQKVFDYTGHIFSVNGPPGTGKTTLLKDIVASTIVEKALFLSRYDTADDAFIRVPFTGGEYSGSYVPPTEKGELFYRYWYKFKDTQVADYSILVTSCNNSAVENISKELPLADKLLPDIKYNDKDSSDMKQRLEEIYKLFSSQDTTQEITAYTSEKDSKKAGTFPEIYFTEYANNLLGDENTKAKTWGLISAPLGKRANVSKFYYDVIKPIWEDFMKSTKDIDLRKPQYKESREIFLEQYRKVEKLQEYLGKLGDVVLDVNRAEINYRNKKEKNESLIENLYGDISISKKQLGLIKEKHINQNNILNSLKAERKIIEENISNYRYQIGNLENQRDNYRKEAFEYEKSVNFLTRIFRRSKYYSALELAQTYRDKALEYEQYASDLRNCLNSELVNTSDYKKKD